MRSPIARRKRKCRPKLKVNIKDIQIEAKSRNALTNLNIFLIFQLVLNKKQKNGFQFS